MMSVVLRWLFLAGVVNVIGAFRFPQTPIRHHYTRHPSRVFATQLDDTFIEATEKVRFLIYTHTMELILSLQVKSALQSQTSSLPQLASTMTKFIEEYAE